jgi:hypothetical protein
MSAQGVHERKCTGRKWCGSLLHVAHKGDHLRRLRVLVLAGLMVLLVAACGGGTTADDETADTAGQTHLGGTTADESGEMRTTADKKSGETRSTAVRKYRGKPTADKKSGLTDATKQTLGLLADLVEKSNEMLAKLAGQQQAYASAGNEQGAQLMVEAADNVKDVQDAALSLQGKLDSEEVGDPPAAGPSGPTLAFSSEPVGDTTLGAARGMVHGPTYGPAHGPADNTTYGPTNGTTDGKTDGRVYSTAMTGKNHERSVEDVTARRSG